MESVREMLKLRFSLNFYMFHGGTNFGFTGGAAFPGHRLPMVTSYGKTRPVPRRLPTAAPPLQSRVGSFASREASGLALSVHCAAFVKILVLIGG